MQEKTGHWVGWTMFASIMMIMVGAFQFVVGLTALLNSTWFLVADNGLTLKLDYTTWGWIHLGIGLLIAVAGAMVLVGSWFGRVIGMLVAAGSALANLVSIAAYPLWSIAIITLDVIVIYTLAVHGGEIGSDEESEMSVDETRVRATAGTN
jgi:hypothetical protein